MGGPGSGKSTIARLFAELGCAIIDADRLAHDALQLDVVKQRVREQWGDSVFNADGTIDRSALGRIVFADPAGLRDLEAIIHPRVHEGRTRERKLHRDNPAVVAIVEDCPLLLERKLDQQCDKLVFVDTPDAIRLQRVQSARRWGAGELKKRDEQQLSLDIKRQAADYVIRNDQDLAHAREQARHVLQCITTTKPA